MKNDITVDHVAAKTFMGLLAANGQVPNATTEMDLAPELFDVIEDEIQAVTAEGINFFELMEREGMMKKPANENKKSRFSLKIVRPAALGGELPLSA